jgi:heterodisulfide reductase subunit A-like polyferredoxin
MENYMENKVVGSVMVVGGGVAGIKAALDLADSGYYVYVVENTPAIGGVMAQLDKTFPTADCSMCILSPYLVETGRHQNIELVTYADVESVKGHPGNFRVKVKKKARSIKTDSCTGCRSCVDNCPVFCVSDFHKS